MPLLPVHYAVRNLARSRARLTLSVLGSTLVVLLVLAAASFVRGMDLSLRTTGGEHNVILMGAGSEESVERSEVPAAAPGILAASIHGIRERAGVPYISPEVHIMLPVGLSADRARSASLRGVTPAATLVHEPIRITAGRFPEPGADEVLVGRAVGVILSLSDAELAPGRQLVIDGRVCTISGRFAAPGTVLEGEIWAPLTDLQTATRRDSISCIIVTLDPEEAEFADIAVFTKMRPDLELVATPERDYYAGLSAFFGPVRAVAWITAGLISLGGLFGGLNTMYAAFASRVRELGTLQSLGFRRAAIVVSLVQESLLATAAGALLACGLGVLLLDGLAVRFSMGAFGLVVDAPVLAIAIGAGLALGVVGALPPAVRCLRLSIPTALKAV